MGARPVAVMDSLRFGPITGVRGALAPQSGRGRAALFHTTSYQAQPKQKSIRTTPFWKA